jgi:hypothetical protein
MNAPETLLRRSEREPWPELLWGLIFEETGMEKAIKSFDLANKVEIVDDAALNGEIRLIFPILAKAIIVFVATAAVTFENMGFHPHVTLKAFSSVVGRVRIVRSLSCVLSPVPHASDPA